MAYILREQFKVTHEAFSATPGYNAHSATFESLQSDAKLAMDSFLHGIEVDNTFEIAFAEYSSLNAMCTMSAEFNFVARLIITDIKCEKKDVYVVNAICGDLKWALTVDEKTAKRFNKDGIAYVFINHVSIN
ncbi:uncharacterized protein LOC141613354 [Silene latifolia]|uniref:uncharacterized protein LOC141613354 n=1 Tax=Silene latifolia TaxID=37657 RepID=UPI003D77573B